MLLEMELIYQFEQLMFINMAFYVKLFLGHSHKHKLDHLSAKIIGSISIRNKRVFLLYIFGISRHTYMEIVQ